MLKYYCLGSALKLRTKNKIFGVNYLILDKILLPQKNFFAGVINGLILVIPLWIAILVSGYVIICE